MMMHAQDPARSKNYCKVMLSTSAERPQNLSSMSHVDLSRTRLDFRCGMTESDAQLVSHRTMP
jgi:hypothetical protein